MGQGAKDKWLLRAEQYGEILHQKGVNEAGKYLRQFEGSKMRKLLQAIWDLHEMKVEEEAEYQASMRRNS